MNKATEPQKKLFFALCKERGYEAEVMKDRAKKNLGLSSFSDISSKQISELIEKLQGKEKHKHDFKLEARSDKHTFYSCSCGSLIINPR